MVEVSQAAAVALSGVPVMLTFLSDCIPKSIMMQDILHLGVGPQFCR